MQKGTQEIPGVTGKFLEYRMKYWSTVHSGVQNEAGQRLIEFCQEMALVIANTLFQHHTTLHMDTTRWSTQKSRRLIIFFAAKDGKLYAVSKNKTGS